MDEETYKSVVQFLIIFNTLDILGKAVICYAWARIARTSRIKMIFAFIAGLLVMLGVIRLVASALPFNYYTIITIGSIYSVINAASTLAMGVMTYLAYKRGKDRLYKVAAGRSSFSIIEEAMDILAEKGKANGWL